MKKHITHLKLVYKRVNIPQEIQLIKHNQHKRSLTFLTKLKKI